jgi:hypothetical protein
MAELSNALKQKLEHLFEMQGGYVLDFSNASFADFIRTSIHVDPYKGYDGSKATILRQLWHDLNDQAFAKLTLEMLDRWRTNKLVEGHEITAPDQQLFEEATAAVKELTGTGLSRRRFTIRRNMIWRFRSLVNTAHTSSRPCVLVSASVFAFSTTKTPAMNGGQELHPRAAQGVQLEYALLCPLHL